ncbi:ubiE/COQ5 methyltransferase-like protein [Maribacter spongiicola]|uniref:UbiE/COQ5 methyltransferase-like protein n=1 Tax=Maribacter spongiicola TaxID=1206753 RepID=A0A4R7JNB5_9FLAO|nr:class I SAM-dependent methyltransferase [Maribacter spongiicola]TDT38697.1 ubiE/COQ5 methyltransferase-like protein [Maribacter spongiicola]
MGLERKPFQGVFNIIRFNWHFYVIAGAVLIVLFIIKYFVPVFLQSVIIWLGILILIPITVSVLTSFYVYDYSDLYKLYWFSDLNEKKVLNVNAGFDETSAIIKHIFPKTDLTICDFYNAEKHTEISMERARKAYPSHKHTVKVDASALPFKNGVFSHVITIFSAHEIRNQNERILFLKELNRITELDGHIYITEHLRDFNNFLAYNIGFLHFYTKSSWLKVFENSDLYLEREIKITPFISTFVLKKNGNTF